MQRRGFTLFELLIVISVLSILGGIVYAGLVTNRGSEGVRSVEGLVASVLRQAKHTAASSGAPVEIKVEQDNNNGWTVRGVTQISLYGEQFEDDATSDPLHALGYAGSGRLLSDRSSAVTLPSRPVLVHSDDDAFYLQASVRPPRSWLGNATARLNWCYPVAIQDANDRWIAEIWLQPQSAVSTGNPVNLPLWSAHVAVNDSNDTVSNAFAEDPITSVGWSTLGLLYRDNTVTLMRDGEAIGSTAANLGVITPPLRVQIGETDSAGGIVDNIRLYRLGDNEAIRLPKFITPADSYRALVYPDGQVVTNSPTWTFQWTGGGSQGTDANTHEAILTIGGDGRISSSLD